MNPPAFVARFNEVRVGLVLLVASGGRALDAAARAYPSKTITVVVPFPSDSSADVTTRQMAQLPSGELGQSVMVHIRSGANGIVGAKLVASSPEEACARLGVEYGHYG